MLRAYKTELDPNDVQRTSLFRHAGAARWAFNFGLKRKQEAYAAWVAGGKQGKHSTPSAIDLHRELNLLKQKSPEDGGVPWMYEVSKCAPQEALRNLDPPIPTSSVGASKARLVKAFRSASHASAALVASH